MLKARLSAMLVKMSFGDKFNAIVVNLEKVSSFSCFPLDTILDLICSFSFR